MTKHGTERCWTCDRPMVWWQGPDGPHLICPNPKCAPRVDPAEVAAATASGGGHRAQADTEHSEP